MRLIAQNTVMVRSALKRSADAKAIADKWLAHNHAKAVTPDTVKYDPDQERDDRGRFGSGSGSSESDSKPEVSTDYRDQHQAPSRADDFGSPATDIEEMMPNFYEHPEWYGSNAPGEFGEANRESIAVIQNIKDDPDATVTIYRAVPKDVNEINQGDWVTLSPTYARLHNEGRFNGEGHILSQEIPASDLWFDGNDVNEFGYDPATVKAIKLRMSKINKEDSINTVRDWVRINITFDNSPMERVLNQLWAASYVFGERDAINELTSNVGFDWDTWKPGNEAASLLVKPPKKLQAILNKSKATASEISRTTADRIGTKLSEGLEQGLGADEIARNINTVLDDPALSMVIARTETADALVQANLETYREAEVELVEWLVGDPCDICAENAGVQVRLGGVFPSGDEAPPAHPNCVCDVAPIVLTAEEMQNMDAFDLASKPDTLKYDPEQERDDHGRFGSGSGGSSESGLSKPLGEQQYGFDHIAKLAEDGDKTFLNKGVRFVMGKMAEQFGFDAKPTVVSKEEFDKIEGQTFYRGIASVDAEDNPVPKSESSEKYAEEFRSGGLFYSYGGVYGTGIYTSSELSTADSYANNNEYATESGVIMEMKLSPDANVIDSRDATAGAKYDFHEQELGGVSTEYTDPDTWAKQIGTTDVGAWALNHGYDAINVKLTATENYMVILNRGAVITHA